MTTGAHTSRQAEPRWKEVESIVGSDFCKSADQTCAIDGAIPSRIVSPGTEEEISEILKWAVAADVRMSVRGGGTKLSWGNIPQAVGLVLSMERISGEVEHSWEDMTFTVKAGTTISALQNQLGAHRQRLALDPLWPLRSTVGGVVATNDGGALRIRFGSVRDLILGVTIVLPNGTLARSGGKVVKNVAGYDLPKLLTGSFGTLGVITEATFRAHPLPQATRTLSFRFADVAAANSFILAMADSSLVPTGLQLRWTKGSEPGINVRFEGVKAGIDAQAERAIELSNQARNIGEADDVWCSREALWQGESFAMVGKFSVLPTAIASAVELIRDQFRSCRVVVQSTGIGLFRGECDSLEHLSQSLTSLRNRMQAISGTLAVLDIPHELKRQIDVFGPVNDAHKLMQRIKKQFDPSGTLNSGRFVGGI
jgi:glycolate oxidase FAD binding subunit